LVTVVIPTLRAGEALECCLRSLQAQTFDGFEVMVVDNSGVGLARDATAAAGARLIENTSNLGFGAAVNQGWRASRSPYIATLNDDAEAQPGWLHALVDAMEADARAGMCASRVVLADDGTMDSAGMLICPDGSSRQRGHKQPPGAYSGREEVLLPSASAAMYRRKMLDEVGGFDEDFFLYCEDTDLGLRGRWAGWSCVYAPEAVVHHRYSHSAGRASSLKAYLVERNRLSLVVKNFPLRDLLAVPCATLRRYAWHLLWMRKGQGAAAQFRAGHTSGWMLPLLALRAHLALLVHAPALWRKRRQVRRTARITAAEFRLLLRRFSISPKEVAAL
jgi:GT2 family glycosyltransferase